MGDMATPSIPARAAPGCGRSQPGSLLAPRPRVPSRTFDTDNPLRRSRRFGASVSFLRSSAARRLLVPWVACVVIGCGEHSPTAPGSTGTGTTGSNGTGSSAVADSGVIVGDDFGGRQLLPADNWWNQDISSAPVDAQSNAYIDFIGRSRGAHPDFGPAPYGFPYLSVSGSQARVTVTWTAYGSESDNGYGGLSGYPIPEMAKTQPNLIEGGIAGGGTSGDRHMLIVDRDRWLLYELGATRWNASAARWEANVGAIFDLASNARRPDGWTSSDAAGLAILPGLVRYDEAVRGPIHHAMRVTVRATNGYVWPASHRAGNTAGALPMGARLRLKASKDLSSYSPIVRNIFRGMQTYGLIVADNGNDLYVSGAMDSRWNNDDLNPAFHGLTANDFEIISLGYR